MTPIRIVCANTQKAALARAKASFTIRHTKGARVAIAEARQALKLAWRYVDAFETEAAALYAQDMQLDEMRQFAATLVKANDLMPVSTPGPTASSRPTASSNSSCPAR